MVYLVGDEGGVTPIVQAPASAPKAPSSPKAIALVAAPKGPAAAWGVERLQLASSQAPNQAPSQDSSSSKNTDVVKRQALADLVRRSMRSLSRHTLATRVGQRSLMGSIVRQSLRSPAVKHGIKGMGQQNKLRQGPWVEPPAAFVGPPSPSPTWVQNLQQTALWRGAAALPGRFPALGVALKLVAPLGAWLNFRSSWRISQEVLKQEGQSGFTRKAMVASTALAGISAVAASGVAGAALGILPAFPGMVAWGSYVACAGGLLSGTLLVAADAVQSFRRADAGPGEKALAVLATGSSLGLSVLAVAGLGGVAGFVLGAAAIAFSLAKAWAPEAAWAAGLGRLMGFQAGRIVVPQAHPRAKALG